MKLQRDAVRIVHISSSVSTTATSHGVWILIQRFNSSAQNFFVLHVKGIYYVVGQKLLNHTLLCFVLLCYHLSTCFSCGTLNFFFCRNLLGKNFWALPSQNLTVGHQ